MVRSDPNIFNLLPLSWLSLNLWYTLNIAHGPLKFSSVQLSPDTSRVTSSSKACCCTSRGTDRSDDTSPTPNRDEGNRRLWSRIDEINCNYNYNKVSFFEFIKGILPCFSGRLIFNWTTLSWIFLTFFNAARECCVL